MRKRRLNLRIQFGRIDAVVIVIISANFGGNRKAGRHRQAKAAHFSQVRPLAAEKVAIARSPFRLAITERVHPLCHSGLP